MKAIITIIVLALVVWGIWWFAVRDNTVGIPATGDTYGQVEGDSDYLDPTASDIEGKG